MRCHGSREGLAGVARFRRRTLRGARSAEIQVPAPTEVCPFNSGAGGGGGGGRGGGGEQPDAEAYASMQLSGPGNPTSRRRSPARSPRRLK